MFLFVWEFQGVRVRLCFSFLAVISLTCLLGGNESGKILVMLGCCCLHECGHIAAMLICRCKPTALTLYGGGIRLTPSRKLKSFAKDAFILASGCAVNFMLAFASCLLTGRLTFFAQTNLLLGGFNLIPTGFLDGGRLIELVLGENKARAVKTVFALLAALLAGVSLHSGGISISLLCVLCYMCLSIFAS
jgi:Zn-dependent protease